MPSLLLSIALAAPHANLQVYFQTQLDDARLQQAVFKQAARAWVVPATKPSLGRKTVVQVLLSNSGKVMSATVSLESGAPQWDKAALKAVQSGAPYPTLPAGMTSVEVHFHFAWEG